MINHSACLGPNQLILPFYSPSLERKQETEIEKESNTRLAKRKKSMQENREVLNQPNLPLEIINEIFSFIQDDFTKVSILKTCRLFCEIGARIFKIQVEDGSFPIIENLMESRENGSPVLLKLLQETSINHRYREAKILPWAIRYRHIQIQRLIIKNPDFNPVVRASKIFNLACQYGAIETVESLLNHPQLKNKIDTLENQSFLGACRDGEVEVIKLLLKDQRFNLADNVKFGFLEASKKGHTEVVKALLDVMQNRIDGQELMYLGIEVAVKYKRLETIQFILKSLKALEQVPNDALGKTNLNAASIKKTSFYEKACFRFNLKETNSKIYPLSIEILMQKKGVKGVLELLQKKKVTKAYKKYVVLPWASRKGRLEVVKLILEDPKIECSGKDKESTSNALIEASKFGHLKVFQALLASKPKDSSIVNHAMQIAIENDSAEIVKFLLETCPNQNFSNLSYNLSKACGNGHLEVVKLLLSHQKVDPSACWNEAIIMASQNGHFEVVKLLLSDNRVDPSTQDNVAVRKASQNGHTEVVKLLLSDTRVDPSAQANEAILVACKNGYSEVVKLLLTDTRVDPSASWSNAIILASENGRLEVVKLLLTDTRVDPSALNNNAINIAIIRGHLEVVRLLLSDQRVNSYEQMYDAIILASSTGHLEVIKLLLNNPKLDASARMNEAIIQASINGHTEVVKFLLSDPRVNSSLRNFSPNI